jgi:uncharacterized SAM-binding protein YcdF (DUF218 family)
VPGEVVVVLGYENGPNGELNKVSIDRCREAIRICRTRGARIVLTGGFGTHFNTSRQPHVAYTKQYLLAQGVDESKIAFLVESGNTIEDATLLKPKLERSAIRKLCVVTSDFHHARAKYVFQQVFAGYELEFAIVPSDPAVAMRHEAHEQRRLDDMRRDGLR